MLYYVYEYRRHCSFSDTKRLLGVEYSSDDADRVANESDLINNDSKQFAYAIVADSERS